MPAGHDSNTSERYRESFPRRKAHELLLRRLLLWGPTVTRLKLTLIGVLSILLLGMFSFSWLRVSGAGKQPVNIDGNPRTPVLIELFTSEGCSSCPAADALLRKLDESQPVSGAELIVLSEHVDYWNDIGWKDPYSSREFSERQRVYAEQFGLNGVYTPQMVVDGHFEFVGSDERRALRTAEEATKVQKVPVVLSSIRREINNGIVLHVEIGPLRSNLAQSGNVLIAVADDNDESHVTNGENTGRTLKHVAVLRSLMPVGTVDGAREFSREVKVNDSGRNSRNLRIVVIVQEKDGGRVWGVGLATLSN